MIVPELGEVILLYGMEDLNILKLITVKILSLIKIRIIKEARKIRKYRITNCIRVNKFTITVIPR